MAKAREYFEYRYQGLSPLLSVCIKTETRGSPSEKFNDGFALLMVGSLILLAHEAREGSRLWQWPRYYSKPLEYTQEELGRLLDTPKEAVSPPDWPAKLAEALRESKANYRLMQQWLNTHTEAQQME